MELGRIVHSNSHPDYVCQIAQRAPRPEAPRPADHAFGTLVGIVGSAGLIVGIIYDTRLLNPEFGNLGPRLSPRDELVVFSPDYIAETATLVGIATLGTLVGGEAAQGVPDISAEVGSTVRTLSEAEIVAFHRPGGRLTLAYLPALMALAAPALSAALVQRVLNMLERLLPDERQRLQVLASTVSWRAALGGLQERS